MWAHVGIPLEKNDNYNRQFNIESLDLEKENWEDWYRYQELLGELSSDSYCQQACIYIARALKKHARGSFDMNPGEGTDMMKEGTS